MGNSCGNDTAFGFGNSKKQRYCSRHVSPAVLTKRAEYVR